MQKHFRNPATWGDFEPGERTVCPTRKTRFRSFIPVVFALLLGFMLIGCGGSDGDDVFSLPDFDNGVFPLPGEVDVEPPTNGEPPANGDEIVTVTGSGDVCLGGATALAIELDRKPLRAVDVELRTLDLDAAFEVPGSVRVPANEAIKVFIVRAKVDAMVGAQAELSIVPGDRYQVGAASSLTLTVADTALPTITILGPGDAIISQGAVESYLLQRSDAPPTVISVPLVVEGDADAFSVAPPEVVIDGGENDRVFEIEAIQSKGGATISFLPPVGYCLGDTTSVDVTIE